VGLPVPGARFVVDRLPAPGEAFRLEGADAAHARARRLSPGDPAVLVDGSGREAEGSVESVGRHELEVRVARVSAAPPDPLPPIHLLVAAVRAERLSWIAEKATELGAATLTLVVSERTQAERARGSLAARLSRVIVEAAKQSEHARWPRVAGPVPYARALADAAPGHRFLLDPRGEPFPAALAPAPTSLLVGPEGGWAEAEERAALAAGWSTVSLSAGKLRAETAAVAALTLARAALSRGAH
jgi:16S rRNA (uracil1498-N3)-methyltransferase